MRPRLAAFVVLFLAAARPVGALAPQSDYASTPTGDVNDVLGPDDLLDARRSATHQREAVGRALAWLARHQEADGSWDADGFDRHCGSEDGAAACEGPGTEDADVGVTALALLAFLGDGHTTRQVDSADGQAVLQGVTWLRTRVDAETGRIGDSRGPAGMYGHALGTAALAEAYRFSRSPLLKEAAQRAVDFVLAARNPYGGWRYDAPPTGDSDSSITSWMTLALRTADEAGLHVDPTAYQGATSWLEHVTDPETGRIGYQSPGSSSSRIAGLNEAFPPERGEALTAAGLLARMLVDGAVEHGPRLERQVALLGAEPPSRGPDGRSVDLVYWFFGAHALAQVGGGPWARWRAALDSALLPAQRTDGHAVGSWDPDGAWGPLGGRVYATALATLCLQADVRYGSLPHRGAPDRAAAAPRAAEPPLARADEEPRREGGTRPSEDAAPRLRRFLSRVDAPARPRETETAEAFRRALDWLVAAQEPRGSWSAGDWPLDDAPARGEYRVGVTGLALLALLVDEAAREERAVRRAVEHGLDWLRERQDPDTGQIGERTGFAQAYEHALATCALAQALAAWGDDALREPAQRAVDFVLRSRNPYAAWRYDSPPVGENDTSVTGWMVMALTCAHDAGLRVSPEARHGALAWLDEMTDPATGRIGYTERGGTSSRVVGLNEQFPPRLTEAMTASGMLARFHLGQVPEREPVLEKHARLLAELPPEWAPERHRVDMIYWFHGAHAMRLMGGRWWGGWRDALEAAVVPAQRRDGELAGSWDPVGAWGMFGGRVYSTALMALSLESCLR